MRLRLKQGEFIFKMMFSLSSPSSMLIKALIRGEGGGGGGDTGLLAILEPLTDREPKTWRTIVLYYTLINS